VWPTVGLTFQRDTYAGAVPRLVALLGPAGPRWVAELQRAWDAGDAVLPADTRLPRPALDALLVAMAPDELVEIGSDGTVVRSPLHGARPVEDGDALVVATSGTTGVPKGVVLTHDAVAASALATSTRLSVDPDRHRWLACLPLSHVGGLSVVTRALHTGTDVEVHDGFDPARALDAASRGATHVSLVATALRRIDPDAFECIVLGGSAPPASRPPHAVATYGMTESGSGVVYDGIPLDGVEVRAVEGELHLRCPMLLRAYRDGSTPLTPDGWFPTGDLGEVDPTTGTVAVHGRAGDLIITGGENVWPTPVEAALAAHPDVREVAVVGRPDPEWGSRVVAIVVPVDPNRPPSLESLREVVKRTLPAHCAPREVEVVASLPQTALGKVRRGDLRAGR
jgi:O-succinylbenzoic acid--CoA ligase